MEKRSWKSSPNSDFYRAVLKLKTLEECYDFFTDLCTICERNCMEQRFSVAKLLNDGMVYTDIQAETGASSTTISRVNRSLSYGTDAYRTLLARLEADEQP